MSTVHVITLSGEVDIMAVTRLRADLHAGVEATQAQLLLIDVTAVTFIDSTGLGLLAALRRQQDAYGGQIALVGASPMLVRLLFITGMDRVLPLLQDGPELIRHLGESADELPR